MLYKPHKAYRSYRVPAFIIHASDLRLTIRTPFGDTEIKRLDEWHRIGVIIYSCVSPDTLLLYGQPERWSIRTWNGRVSSMTYADVKVYPLMADGWDDSILSFFEYLDDMRVACSSLNTMSLNLWRTTLSRPIGFRETSDVDTMLGPVAALVGGRKEARQGVFRNRHEYDMTAAYPTALAEGMSTRLHPTTEEFAKSCDIFRHDGIARARVRIPTLTWGPLPVVIDRKASVTSYGFTRPTEWTDVVLPLSELRMAVESGCDVVCDEVRLVSRHENTDSFARWHSDIVSALRVLPRMGGTLGKLVSNRLWSCFAVSPYGSRQEHTFSPEGVMITRQLPADSPAQVKMRASTAYIGAIVQSRVRERLYREGLSRHAGVIYVDTDGLISSPTDPAPGWRDKTRIRWCDIAGPQAIVYTCDNCSVRGSGRLGHQGPHWTVAGATTTESKSRLHQQVKEGATVTFNIGNVIPPCDVVEARRYASTETNKGRKASPALQYLQTL